MSWLSDIKYDCHYECSDKHVSIFDMTNGADGDVDRADRTCLECGQPAAYTGFVPKERISLFTKVAYEHNGRKGYRVTDGRGGVHHVSESKMRYTETGDVVPGYTREYAAHLKATGRSDLLETSKREDIIKARKEGLSGSKITAAKAEPV